MSVAKILHDAKNAAGMSAVAAAKREDYVKAREWSALAVEIDRLMRDAIAVALPTNNAPIATEQVSE